MKTVTVYGIKNCSTVKKALKWLSDHQIEYQFHDYKLSGITEDRILIWQRIFGWEPLVNRKGMTWRKLEKTQQDLITDASSARMLMIEKTSLIKRPILEYDAQTLLGFDADAYRELFKV